MWPEIEYVIEENKRELSMSGKRIQERIKDGGLDTNIAKLKSLNLLRISEVDLEIIPNEIFELINLQTLILYGNKISEIPKKLALLQKLKFLDISRNKLVHIPNELSKLINLTTIILSNNELQQIPCLDSMNKLAVLDLSFNKITSCEIICNGKLTSLAEVNLKNNKLDVIPNEIAKLINLKVINFADNQIKAVPKAIVSIPKLKEIDLGGNPLEDKRLLKLVKQCKTKQILDYVKINGKGDILVDQNPKAANPGNDMEELCISPAKTIHIQKSNENTLQVAYDDTVKNIRPYIICCLVHDIKLDSEQFKKFLQLQNKLHDTVCAHREKSAIATHDLSKIKGKNLLYTARSPKDITIWPLNKPATVTGEELFNSLKAEAEVFRKEKKRSTYSAMHKYLYLLEGNEHFVCLQEAEENVISLHPLTNSDLTKVTTDTKDIFIEVSSNDSMISCRKAMEGLLLGMLNLDIIPAIETGCSKMTIEQVKIFHKDGTLKCVYPSKTDLQLDKSLEIKVKRD